MLSSAEWALQAAGAPLGLLAMWALPVSERLAGRPQEVPAVEMD